MITHALTASTLSLAGLRPTYRQTTLRAPFTLSGAGMHTGACSRVTLRPAPADSGITFVRRREAGTDRIPALAAYVVSTRRCTSVGCGDVRIDTVEHVLSALAGLQIDNAEIDVDGLEMPILDGSAQPWVEAILSAGIDHLDAEAEPITLAHPVAHREGDTWLVATPADRFSLTCVTHFDHPLLGLQAATFYADAYAYAREVAPARTFGFAHEVDALIAAGLALGGTLDNALIVFDDRFSDALRVPDECLRHKALDLFGDLSLAGKRIQAAVTAVRPGHQANAAFAGLLAQHDVSRRRGPRANGR